MVRFGARLNELHLRQREADFSAMAATAPPREGVSALSRLVATARQTTGQGYLFLSWCEAERPETDPTA